MIRTMFKVLMVHLLRTLKMGSCCGIGASFCLYICYYQYASSSPIRVLYTTDIVMPSRGLKVHTGRKLSFSVLANKCLREKCA